MPTGQPVKGSAVQNRRGRAAVMDVSTFGPTPLTRLSRFGKATESQS